ncbi:plasmid mobilization protein [Paraburkholderia sp. GAS42]|uniref:plasmid mobilization protein n=1 Tax=Paraburkholderia sp. GAS42 TaxID=3035135 RepID=UPI003D24C902
MTIDVSKRRRRGPVPLDSDDKRDHTVSVRLNAGEIDRLDSLRARVSMQRGEYLRAAALHQLPPTIPAINREAWAAMARVAGNLNQYQTAINEGWAHEYPLDFLRKLRNLVNDLRRDLIGVRPASDGGEEE